jgi:cyclopropane fatty-acyl-phospholipid synthase-like methyltransferase
MSADYRSRIYGKYFTASYGVVNAPDDAAFRQAEGGLKQLLVPRLPADREARILDAGCGIGYAVETLLHAGYRNTRGVDGSAEQVEIAQRRGLPVELGDALETLRGTPGQWQAILALDFIEHLHKDELLSFLDLAREALAPGGRLILKTPNASSPMGPRSRYRDLTHELIFTEQSLREALLVCDLRVVEITGDRFLPFTALGWMRYVATSLFQALWRVYLVAELGKEGLGIPLHFNLLAVAQRP